MSSATDPLAGAPGLRPSSTDAILDHLPDVVVRYDADDVVLYVNAAFVAVTGARRETIVGRPAMGLDVAPETVALFAEARRRVFATGEMVTFDICRATAAGERHVQYRMVPEYDASRQVATVLAIGRDVTELYRTVEALRASEARYRSLAEASSQIVWRTGPRGERVDDATPWVRYTGRAAPPPADASAEDVLWVADVHPDDRDRVLAAWRAAMAAGTAYEEQYRLRRADGAWRVVTSRGVPVRDERGAVREWIGTVTDVTEREAVRVALEAERARLAEAQRIGRIGSWQWNLVTGEAHVSDEWVRIFGVAPGPDVSPPDTFVSLLLPDDRARYEAKLAHLRAERPATTEGRWHIERPDGERRVVHMRSMWEYDSAGALVAGTGTFQDVTEEVRAQARLARQQALLEESQRIAGVGSWDWDLTTDVVVWTDQLYRISGMERDDRPMTLERVRAALHPDDRAAVRAITRASRESGEPAEFEYRMVRPDGAVRLIQSRTFPVADAAGRVTRLVGTVQDVTERRALEAQVRQAQKVEALGMLAGGIAHDFNNLLSAILGGAELARLEVPDDSEAARDLDDVRQAAARAAQLTRQLLAFSRKQVRRPRAIDLGAAARGAEPLLRRLLPEHVALDLDGGPLGACVVRADPAQLEQVLMNLVVNARDAILATGAPGDALAGVITVRVERVRRDGADRAALTVSDTGVGMNDATRAHLFEPFFTTKPAGHGTGIGLATVLGIVTQSGGTIAVDSAPRAGATFTVLLPLVDVPADAPELGAAEPPTGTETILLVEDETVVRETATRILERHGYHVVAARHGGDALLAWQARGGAIDLLVTDLRMPEVGGRSLAARLRAERPSLPILVMSGYASGQDPAESELLARETFLAKPFTTASLLFQVRAALDRPAAGDDGGQRLTNG